MKHGNQFTLNAVERETLLLVEGIDDARFFRALLQPLGLFEEVQIVQVGGKPNFRPFITGTLKLAPNFALLRRLGVIRDADHNASAAFQSLRGALGRAEFPEPTRPWETAHGGTLKVSVAILPDEESEGNLETLCLRSLPAEHLSCIDEYVGCIGRVAGPVSDNQMSKARTYTYLAPGPVPSCDADQSDNHATRVKPGLRVGEAAEAGVWDWQSPAFEKIADFLKKLATP